MTREIAKRIVKGITDKIECNTADIDDWAEFWGFTREEYEEFLDMPIKALEQESASTQEYGLTDEDKDKYAVQVQNGEGYYNSFGRYVSYDLD